MNKKVIKINTKVQSSNLEKNINECKILFDNIINKLKKPEEIETHKIELLILKELMKLGLKFLKFFFDSQNENNSEQIIKTNKGTATRGKIIERSYFSIFGKLKIKRYNYHLDSRTFVPLDLLLNLPKRSYSFALSEMINMLTIRGSYLDGVNFIYKYFKIKLPVSGAETISEESSALYENYYESNPVS